MYRLSVRLNAVLLLCSFVFVGSEVTVENGGYNVLVSFAQNIPYKDRKVTLENMKASLEDASKVLHNAIGLQFSKVTFEIPLSWDISKLDISNEEFSSPSSSKADFVVDNANDVVFGKLPFSQQHGGCGTPARQITVPTAFFDESNTFTKGIPLAREWLKYRYGVFDENGFLGDPLYPPYYVTPGRDRNEVEITECTNAELAYTFMGDDGSNCSTVDSSLFEKLKSGECKIKLDEENSGNVTSSFMYLQKDISTIQHICGRDDDHQHNSRAPNKQNALCFGQSIWDVVNNSRDFQGDEVNKEYTDIEYTYVNETKPKVVVAVENVEGLDAKESIIVTAIHQLIIDLPEGSKFCPLPFTSRSEIEGTLQDITGTNGKGTIMKDISLNFDFADEGHGDIIEAIKKAVEILQSDASNPAEAEGTIVVIARSIEGLKPDSVQDILKDLKICIKFLFFNEATTTSEEVNFASTLPCGEVANLLMDDEKEKTFDKLVESMETILPSTTDDKATETLQATYLSKESPINLQVDELVDTVTFYVYGRNQKKNFKLKLDGEQKSNDMKMEIFDMVTVFWYSPPQLGEVDFEFSGEEKLLTKVRKTSKTGKYFTGEIFVEDTSSEESDQMPVIIYAKIGFGAYPVQNAEVTATVERPNENSTELELKDNGKGDPDITQNDGIYSRYFTDFSESGMYTVTVTVKNKGFVTTYGSRENADFQTCCGSSVDEGTQKLKEFSRTFKTTFTASGGRPEDGYKPSRIVDLRIDDKKTTDDKIVLTWSAPGNEADSGTVQSYEIKRFTSKDEAMKNFDDGNALFDYSASPKESGETETFEINMVDFKESGSYYIAMKANNSKMTSDVSNLVEVYIPDQTTDTPVTDETKEDTSKTGGVNSKTVGIIIGSIIGVMILVIIVYLIVYYAFVKPKRRKEKQRKKERKEKKDNPDHESGAKADNTVLNPVNFVSADTLIKHHNERTKAKNEHRDPPIFKEEDFEDRNSLNTNEAVVSNNDQEPENRNRTSSNEQPLPAKSPKRTTPV